MSEGSKIAFIFPGQGSQSVGMGRDVYQAFTTARAVFEEADRVTGIPLTRLIFEGPEDELRQTINTQPAIVTVSLACLKAIQEANSNREYIRPSFLAGHSLGEYAALAGAGVLEYGKAIYLVRERGRLMFEAGQKVAGAMAAVLGMVEKDLAEICRETGTVIANYNCPGQLVISGKRENVEQASKLAKQRGALRVVPLQVSGAFHSDLMQPAVIGLSEIISKMDFKNPEIPVIGNVTAGPLVSVEEIKQEMTTQLNNGVRWQHSIEYMIKQGVNMFVEIGPGKVLTGLIKRIDRSVSTFNVSDVQSIIEFSNLRGISQ